MKGTGSPSSVIHRLIHTDAYQELHETLKSWPPNHVALWRWSRDNQTMLHMLAQRTPRITSVDAAVQLMRWLLEPAGGACDIEAENTKGQTPLRLAVECNNGVIAKALIAGGADMRKHSRGPERAMSMTKAPLLPLHFFARGRKVILTLLRAGYPPWDLWHIDWVQRRKRFMDGALVLIGVWTKRWHREWFVERHVMKRVIKMIWERF